MTKPLNQPPDGFTCAVCGEYHKGLPLDVAFGAPLYWDQIPEAERTARGELTPDFCAIDDRDFFVRGLIDIWRDPKIVEEPPYFGWLANKLPGYPDTFNLKTNVQSRNVKWRPYVTLEPIDHPLALEQRNGISFALVQEITALTLHPEKL